MSGQFEHQNIPHYSFVVESGSIYLVTLMSKILHQPNGANCIKCEIILADKIGIGWINCKSVRGLGFYKIVNFPAPP